MGSVCSAKHSTSVFATDAAQPVSSAEAAGKYMPNRSIRIRRGAVEKFYELEADPIGRGGFGVVSRGRHRASGMTRAIKSVPRGSATRDRFTRQEFAIMKEMDHPYVIKLFESFEDDKAFSFAMELCSGGELLDHIIGAPGFGEAEAAQAMHQILQAVNYIHGKRIMHRDLKPENFLFVTKEPLRNNTLKLIDFGLACRFEPSRLMTRVVGSAYFLAPEVLERQYNHMCDLWSCGIIMYLLLCGRPPFTGASDNEVLESVQRGVLLFDQKYWADVSDDAKNLIKALCRRDFAKRCDAATALQHEWITSRASKADGKMLSADVASSLHSFQALNKMKKAALGIIAWHLNDEKLKDLREIFASLDTDHDGCLTESEIREGLEKVHLNRLTDQQLHQCMEAIDVNGSGEIEYTEFLAAALDRRSHVTEELLRSAFLVFDRDGSGEISEEELRVLCGSSDNLLKTLDTDGNGQISFEEFKAMMYDESTVTMDDAGGYYPAAAAEASRAALTGMAATESSAGAGGLAARAAPVYRVVPRSTGVPPQVYQNAQWDMYRAQADATAALKVAQTIGNVGKTSAVGPPMQLVDVSTVPPQRAQPVTLLTSRASLGRVGAQMVAAGQEAAAQVPHHGSSAPGLKAPGTRVGGAAGPGYTPPLAMAAAPVYVVPTALSYDASHTRGPG